MIFVMLLPAEIESKTDKIFVSSEILDDGRLISTIEITITKINNQ